MNDFSAYLLVADRQESNYADRCCGPQGWMAKIDTMTPCSDPEIRPALAECSRKEQAWHTSASSASARPAKRMGRSAHALGAPGQAAMASAPCPNRKSGPTCCRPAAATAAPRRMRFGASPSHQAQTLERTATRRRLGPRQPRMRRAPLVCWSPVPPGRQSASALRPCARRAGGRGPATTYGQPPPRRTSGGGPAWLAAGSHGRIALRVLVPEASEGMGNASCRLTRRRKQAAKPS